MSTILRVPGMTLADQGGRGGHPPCYVNTLLRQNQILFSNNVLYVPSLSLFKYDVNKEGDSSFTDIRWQKGVGSPKGPKFADIILEQPLIYSILFSLEFVLFEFVNFIFYMLLSFLYGANSKSALYHCTGSFWAIFLLDFYCSPGGFFEIFKDCISWC